MFSFSRHGRQIEKAVDQYLTALAGECAVTPALLIYAIGPTIKDGEKKMPRAFNIAADSSSFMPNWKMEIHLRTIALWLGYEEQRGAPWATDKKERLLGKNIQMLHKIANRMLNRIPPEDQPKDVVHDFSYDKEYWNRFSPNQSPRDFYLEMTEGLPASTILKLDLREDGAINSILYFYADTPPRSFDFYRKFKHDEKTVEHSRAAVGESSQGKGISRTVNRNLLRLYKKRDIEKIELSAQEIGAYVWGRAGFVPLATEWETTKEKISQRLDWLEANPCPKKGPLRARHVSSMRTALASPDPKNFWFIVDQSLEYHGAPLGKILTLPCEYLPQTIQDTKIEFQTIFYSAAFSFNDPDCVARYETYLAKAPKQKPRPRHELSL